MYGVLEGDGPANDAVVNNPNKGGSDGGNHQPMLNPSQFKGMLGKGGGAGAEAGAAGEGASLSELAMVAA